jgi:hypothetical protein
MDKAQIYTIVALCVYSLAMALIGCISYGKSKTLDGFLIGSASINLSQFIEIIEKIS